VLKLLILTLATQIRTFQSGMTSRSNRLQQCFYKRPLRHKVLLQTVHGRIIMK